MILIGLDKLSKKQKFHMQLLYIKWFITEDIWYYIGISIGRRSKLFRIKYMQKLFRRNK